MSYSRDQELLTNTVWAAIREIKGEGRSYIDISTISCIRRQAEDRAAETNIKIPQWARANPVVSFREVVIALSD